MMLFEEGHFLLDDPVATFLPEFAHTRVFVRETPTGVELADLEQPITIRHLLMHTSGLTYESPAADAHPVARMYAQMQIRRSDELLVDNVRRLAAMPLAHQPGATFTYGRSHDVLGRLVEVISGKPFDEFLRTRVFGPLEMHDTDFHVPAGEANRLAAVHVTDEAGHLQLSDRPELDRLARPAYLSGGGGLVSTASDYARFCQMLLDGGAHS